MTGPRPGPGELSAAELRVVILVGQGLTNQEAGKRLGLSPSTIKSHLERIGDRLGIGERAGIVAYAIRSGQWRVEQDRPAPSRFSVAHAQVLELLVLGVPNAGIGERLELPYETVRSRVERMQVLFGVRTRAAVPVGAARCGLLRSFPGRGPERASEGLGASSASTGTVVMGSGPYVAPVPAVGVFGAGRMVRDAPWVPIPGPRASVVAPAGASEGPTAIGASPRTLRAGNPLSGPHRAGPGPVPAAARIPEAPAGPPGARLAPLCPESDPA